MTLVLRTLVRRTFVSLIHHEPSSRPHTRRRLRPLYTCWHTALREIALETGLDEEVKWGFPAYTFKKKNIFMLGSFKEYSSIMFFKGALLSDPENILVQPTENSNSGRQLRFTNAKDILKAKKSILAYIYEATELEKSGAKVEAKKTSEYPMPDELKNKFKELPELKAAFEKLTPGRQRGYLLHFSQAKQSATRLSRQ